MVDIRKYNEVKVRKASLKVFHGDLDWDDLLLFNIFMNDAFLNFIQKCDFVNYADDDSLSNIASTIESFMKSLIHSS